mgnify:CR=1 FL=1
MRKLIYLIACELRITFYVFATQRHPDLYSVQTFRFCTGGRRGPLTVGDSTSGRHSRRRGARRTGRTPICSLRAGIAAGDIASMILALKESDFREGPHSVAQAPPACDDIREC